MQQKSILQPNPPKSAIQGSDDDNINTSEESEGSDEALFRSIEEQKEEMAQASIPTPRPRDPLIASLTSPGPPPKEGTETKEVPLLGEIPIDGSLLVLVPAAAIGVIGLIMSIVVAFNSRDKFVETLAGLNPPPPKQVVVKKGCRGICSAQEENLDDLRGFMEKLSNRKVSDVSFSIPAPIPKEPASVEAVAEVAPLTTQE